MDKELSKQNEPHHHHNRIPLRKLKYKSNASFSSHSIDLQHCYLSFKEVVAISYSFYCFHHHLQPKPQLRQFRLNRQGFNHHLLHHPD